MTLDRPERRNALTVDGLDALAEAVADPPTPVVYLHGAGAAFCAGADLDVVAAVARESATDAADTTDANANENTNANSDAAADFARRGQRVARAIEDSPAVVVAGIDGAARGGGVELALACDLRVATPDATFAETGVTFGLFGAWGGTHRLRRVLGEGDALDVALSGRTLDAEEALRTGLVSRVRDDPFAVAREVADNDPAALRELKALMRGGSETLDGGSGRGEEAREARNAQEAREAEAFARLVADHAEALGRGTGGR